MKPYIGIVLGDAAGIGPEIVLKTLAAEETAGACRATVLGSPGPFREMAERLGLSVDVEFIDCDVRHDEPFRWKVATATNGENTLSAIRKAVELGKEGRIDGVVLGPLSKEALHLGGMREADEGQFMKNAAGVPWVRLVVRWGNIFRTSVVGHVPFREILDNLSPPGIVDAIRVLNETMRVSGVDHPRIGVAAINPHASDGGAFGDEEATIIEPAIQTARQEGIDADGPHPADTVFCKAMRGDFQGVVFMHHDQGNAPMKAAAFGEGVVLYRGLPFPCVTVGHGPAYGRAGEGRADPANFALALSTAVDLARSSTGSQSGRHV